MAKLFIARPVFAIVVALLIVLVGTIAAWSLPIAQYPQITLPSINVAAAYPGAGALAVEQSLAAPIEEQVNGIDGMLYMESSSSSNGGYSLNVTFGLERDADIAAVQVQNRVAQANARLPSETLDAGVTTTKSTSDFLMFIAFYSPDDRYDELFLSNYASINVVEALRRIAGVGRVQVFGSDFGMRIWLHPDRMARLAVTPADVMRAVQEQNVQAPAGQVGQYPAPKGQQFQYGVEVRGRLSQPEEFANIIVHAQPDGSFVRVGDIARVELAAADYQFVSKYNGRRSAALQISPTADADVIETADAVRATLAELSLSFPAGMKADIVYDSTVFVRASLEEVVQTLGEALLLVLVVVFVFLQNWRATLIPMLAVPVSLVGTFAVFTLLGFSINTLTLFAMVLAIGIVVDDAIVVVEAVEHHMHESKLDARAATIRAMEEVSGPVVAIALVLSAVFVPVAFLGGIAGALYRQFAITVAVATLLSAFVALSLTPALTALLLKPRVQRRRPVARAFGAFERGFGWLTERYGRGVALAIRRLAPALVLLVVLFAAAGWLTSRVPGEFVPPEDQGYLLGAIALPEAAALDRTIAVGDQVNDFLLKTPGVTNTLVISGFNILTNSPQSNGALFVTLLEPWDVRAETPGKDLKTIIGSVFGNAAKIPQGLVLAFNPPPLPGLGTIGGFSLQLQDRGGNTPQELAEVADAFVAALAQRPEVVNPISKFNPRTPAYRVEVDREKAKKLGVAVSDVYVALQSFLGGVQVNDFNRFGRSYRVTMQAEGQFRGDISALALFSVRSAAGEMVPLSTLVTTQSIAVPSTITRYNLFRTANIGGDAAPGYSSGQAIAAVEEVARSTLPAGYGYEWSGISAEEKKSAGQAPLVFGLAIVFVFLFLAALYESWAVPLAVLFAVPLGVLGAMGALAAVGLSNNIYAQIGLILLIGLAAKNAILIVEFAKVRRDAGMDAAPAAIEAARLRLRPIVMTSLAFILGVVPLVLASGAGAAARVSMGVTVFAGMLAATVLGIFFVPVLFVAVDRAITRLRRRPAGQPGPAK